MSQDSSNVLEININPEVIKNKKLMIATPMYGGNCTAIYCLSAIELISIAKEHSVGLGFQFTWNDALVTRARNNLVDTFLKSDFEYLMFIDGDIKFNSHDVMYMLQVMVEQDDKKIIVGTYPKKRINWRNISIANKNKLIKTEKDYEEYSGDYVVNFSNNKDDIYKEFNLLEPVEILDGGTGFMMIKREVFEKFAEAYPEQTYIDHDTKEKMVAYFDCKIDPDDDTYLSEDYMFTRWVKKIGIKTWLLPWVKLNHLGTYLFGGSFLSQSALIYELNTQKEKE
jgi:hypothetical protein